MRIAIIYHGAEFPPSERIEKTAKSLTAAGHQVYLVCNNDGRFPLNEEQVGDVHVLRVKPTFGSVALNKIVKFPAPFNPLWLAQIASAIRRFRIEALQVVDIPLAGAALYLGRMFKLPVVLDMWENYPEALRGWAQHDWKTRVFKNPDAARAVELHVVRRVDHIFTVVEEQKVRLIDDGVPAERISVVTNGVDLGMFLQTPVRHDTPMDAEPDCYKLLYVGELTIERGLDDIIRAMRTVAREVPRVRFYIAGTGSYEPQLRRVVEDEGAGEYVRFLGWLPFREIHSYIVKSDLCLVPHVYNDFINTTIPNKLFQYMAMAKPVLVSHAKPLARIVRECNCGFVFESRNPADAAARILDAYRARADRGYGERGRLCAEQKYTWDHAAVGLVECYERLSRGSAG
ncbi:MAG: glycosyltransferase family 4 protein [Bryobacterales bacterium]|nr:glycosyltransferase family 4 protein [Bryobacterales bacterium]